MKIVKYNISIFTWLIIPIILIFIMISTIIYPLINLETTENIIKKRSVFGFYGKGTLSSPYEISSVNDLKKFRDLVNNGEKFWYTYFKQTKDLDLREIDNWQPIGMYGTDNYFYGFYNGAGHTLSNLKIDGGTDNSALFGTLCGEVRNLGIESGVIKGGCVGSIAGHGDEKAAILNCYNKASVHGLFRAGGIADNFNGKILFSINIGDVTCDSKDVAGICGYNSKLIDHCYSLLNPVNNYFTGEINDSERIVDSDISLAFIQTFNDELFGYNFEKIDSGNFTMMEYKKNNIYFSDKQNEKDIDKTMTYAFYIVIMLSILLLMIVLDFWKNIKKGGNYGR